MPADLKAFLQSLLVYLYRAKFILQGMVFYWWTWFSSLPMTCPWGHLPVPVLPILTQCPVPQLAAPAAPVCGFRLFPAKGWRFLFWVSGKVGYLRLAEQTPQVLQLFVMTLLPFILKNFKGYPLFLVNRILILSLTRYLPFMPNQSLFPLPKGLDRNILLSRTNQQFR